VIKDTIKIIKKYLNLINENKFYVTGLFFSSIIGNSFELLIPIATAEIIEMLTIANYTLTFTWIIILAILYILFNVTYFFYYHLYVINYKHIHADLQSRLINKAIILNDEFYKKNSKGKILNTNVTDLENLSSLLAIIIEFIIITIKIIIMAIIFLKTNIYIGLFVLLLNIVYINILDINNKKGMIHLEEQKKYVDKTTDILSESLQASDEVQIYHLMPKLNKKFNIFENKWGNEFSLKHKYITRQHTVLPNIVNLGKCVLYALFLVLIIKEKIGIDVLILLISYYDLIVNESTELMNINQTIRDNLVSIKRFDSILNYKKINSINYGNNYKENIFGIIEFKDVSFKYKEKKILSHLNLKIKPNEITTFLGRSGSGKTTITNLLLRKEKINSGEILIDGINIYDYNSEIYHSNVTSVSKNSYIFNMSIKENLALVDNNEKNQIEACKKVGIHDLIMELPQGYKTIINESNSILTDEQKLLISIARSILTKAEIIIFDEIANILEDKSLDDYIKLCKNLKKHHTIIVMTHKKEITKIADHIYLLKNGEIIGEGTEKELNIKNEEYKFFNKKK